SSKGGGDRLAHFVSGKAINPFINNELQEVIKRPSLFRTARGNIAYCYEATVLADLCDAVLEAKKRMKLQKQQMHIAEQCEILMRGFARVGIIALVDEATGYQEVRDRLALQKILEKYITDEWAKWTKTFPDEYYKELFRLHDIRYPPIAMKRPGYIGHWTNDIVYSRLAPGVLSELKKKNPRQPSGHRKRRHHQYLTRDFGHPVLREHLSNIIFLMKSCAKWDDFKRRLNRASPKYGDTIPFDFSGENLHR
ncbi:MAG: P63C domain-containing protein, partial [Candidatus Hodarchaeota archaeon]